MPPQTNVYVTAPQASKAKGFLGFFKIRSEADEDWSASRALGSSRRRTARRPVLE